MSEVKSHSSLNPKTTSYEFLGPPGALAITFGVPALAYVLYFACNESSGGCPPPIQSLYPSLVQAVSDPAFWWKLWDPKAFAIYYSWYAFCLLTWAVLPGDWVQGTQLRNGKYQQYKINGAIFIIYSQNFFGLELTGRVSVLHMSYGPWPFYWLHRTIWSRVVHVLL
jgi:delta14-sterol reductase